MLHLRQRRDAVAPATTRWRNTVVLRLQQPPPPPRPKRYVFEVTLLLCLCCVVCSSRRIWSSGRTSTSSSIATPRIGSRMRTSTDTTTPSEPRRFITKYMKAPTLTLKPVFSLSLLIFFAFFYRISFCIILRFFLNF